MLAAFDLSQEHPWASLEVYTHGAPRPGNEAFAEVGCRRPVLGSMQDVAIGCSVRCQARGRGATPCSTNEDRLSRLLA